MVLPRWRRDLQSLNEKLDDGVGVRDMVMIKNGGTRRGEPIIVEGCGLEAINGVYMLRGEFDGVPRYTRTARYNGREEEFSLFRCRLTDNTRLDDYQVVVVVVACG